MVSSRRSRTLIILALLIALAAVCVFMDLSWVFERKCYSFSKVWDILTGNGTWAEETIVFEINAPRIVAGLFVGAGLAVTGAAMQAVFRNPLASPYILGLSSGASLGAAIGMLFTIPFIPAIMAFRGFACVMSRMEQTAIIGAMRAISLQSALPRFPMVQKTMPSSLSPEMNVRKDTRADRSEDTATPDRMSVSVFTPP